MMLLTQTGQRQPHSKIPNLRWVGWSFCMQVWVLQLMRLQGCCYMCRGPVGPGTLSKWKTCNLHKRACSKLLHGLQIGTRTLTWWTFVAQCMIPKCWIDFWCINHCKAGMINKMTWGDLSSSMVHSFCPTDCGQWQGMAHVLNALLVCSQLIQTPLCRQCRFWRMTGKFFALLSNQASSSPYCQICSSFFQCLSDWLAHCLSKVAGFQVMPLHWAFWQLLSRSCQTTRLLRMPTKLWG